MTRYTPQTRFAPFGTKGQQRIAQSRVLICGCGALGNTLAMWLARSGVGHLRIIDRDIVELSNLHRQILFDENDAASGTPKAIAAVNKLLAINSSLHYEPIVADLNDRNIATHAQGVDLILDATDNFETRFLINDFAVKEGLPWIYTGCVGAEAQIMTILPGKTPCLRCLMEQCPPPGSLPTCDTLGILGPIVGVIASIESMEALKILSGNASALSPYLTRVDLWENRIQQIDVSQLRDQVDCPTCKQGDYPWLSGRETTHAASLCGRNAVQLQPPEKPLSLKTLHARLAPLGNVTCNEYLLRFQVDGYDITLFADGRTIISGTNNEATAKTIYARYIGT